MNLFDFDANRTILNKQYNEAEWIDGGLTKDELQNKVLEMTYEVKDISIAMIKAKTFKYILENAQIAIDNKDIFNDKINAEGIMNKQRYIWLREVYDSYFSDDLVYKNHAYDLGAITAEADFGHTSLSRDLIDYGYGGLLDRLHKHMSSNQNLAEEQKEFYESCEIVLNAIMGFILRLAEAVKQYDLDSYECLKQISRGKPTNIYEAMQLMIIHYRLHEYVFGTRLRTLGRLDKLLFPYYENDIKTGKYTKVEIKQMLKYFLNKFWAAKVPFDMPFLLGGMDENGNEVTNELSYMIVETYNELNIYSPKIHIRVSEKTPPQFIKLVLNCIRGGNSSFVFSNDNVTIKALQKAGIGDSEAKDYVLIGCYEPAAWGVELGCTGCASINLAKAIELVMTGGKDLNTGVQLGLPSGEIRSFDDFENALKLQIKYLIDKAIAFTNKLESHYMEISPDPIISSTIYDCVKKGKDAYDGGAKYNNTSLQVMCVASFVDAVLAVKELVFNQKLVSYDELCEILKKNWEGNEKLRLTAKKLMKKYGNGNKEADMLTKQITQYTAGLINNKANGRGGVYKAGLFTIDECFRLGKVTMATPDGRFAGEPLSKNLCAVTGMDKCGITALMKSAAEIDFNDFPNGAVLDFVLHPSAVKGDDGLNAMYGLLKSYFAAGGALLHGNVFNSEDLKKAQERPEAYSTLQVRVCGWNAYFVTLSKEEQDAFIAQAENAL